MNRTSTGLAALLLTASVGLTACGSSGHDAKSGSGGSAKSGGGSVSTTSYRPLTKETLARAMAAAVTKAKSAHMVMKTGETSIASDFSLASGKPAMKMTMGLSEHGKSITFHEILSGGALYMSAPGLTPAGKYVKVDSSTPGIGSMLGSVKSLDPTKMLTSFSKNVDSLTYRGDSTIDGATVHHYTLTMKTKNLLGSIDLGAAGSMLKQEEAQLPKKISEQIYLNGDNSTRRVTFDMSNTPVTVDITKWGEPVSVSAPPKSAIVPLSSMMGGSTDPMAPTSPSAS